MSKPEMFHANNVKNPTFWNYLHLIFYWFVFFFTNLFSTCFSRFSVPMKLHSSISYIMKKKKRNAIPHPAERSAFMKLSAEPGQWHQ